MLFSCQITERQGPPSDRPTDRPLDRQSGVIKVGTIDSVELPFLKPQIAVRLDRQPLTNDARRLKRTCLWFVSLSSFTSQPFFSPFVYLSCQTECSLHPHRRCWFVMLTGCLAAKYINKCCVLYCQCHFRRYCSEYFDTLLKCQTGRHNNSSMASAAVQPKAEPEQKYQDLAFCFAISLNGVYLPDFRSTGRIFYKWFVGQAGVGEMWRVPRTSNCVNVSNCVLNLKGKYHKNW